MIIVLKDANFANNNIGEVEVPRLINQFTLNAIAASGNTFTEAQTAALDDFFEAVGAFGTQSSIWSKLSKVYMPMLAGSLARAVVNYKDNNVDVVPSDYYKIVNHGITRNGENTSTDKISFDDTWNWNNRSVYVFLTEELATTSHGVIGKNNVTSANWRALRLIQSSSSAQLQACAKGTTTYLSSVASGLGAVTPMLRGATKTGTSVAYLNGTTTTLKTGNGDAAQYCTDDSCTIFPFAAATDGGFNSGTPATGAFFWGAGLTAAEAETLGAAMQTLWTAINV